MIGDRDYDENEYYLSDRQADETEREQEEERLEKQGYIYSWCEKCKYLQVCYYQHGERSGHPHALNPECQNGGD